MSDETLIDRAVRRTRKDYEGEDRRGKPPFDWVRLLPVGLALLAGYGGYQVLNYRVDRLEADFKDFRAEQKEAYRVIWQRIGEGEPR